MTRSVEVTCYDSVADAEFDADISISSVGYPSNGWDDPGEGPEWEIDKIRDHEGNEVKYTFLPELIPIHENPEWQRLAAIVEDYMENNFDWDGYIPDFYED